MQLTREQQQMVVDHLDLADIWLRCKCCQLDKRINRAEAYAEACFQLCRAAQRIQHHQNIRAYLWRGVCLGMATWVAREALPPEQQLLTDCPAPQSNDCGLNWQSIMDDLPARLRVVVERYYVSGNTFRDIANDLGVCAQRAQQLRDQAIRLLRERLTA